MLHVPYPLHLPLHPVRLHGCLPACSVPRHPRSDRLASSPYAQHVIRSLRAHQHPRMLDVCFQASQILGSLFSLPVHGEGMWQIALPGRVPSVRAGGWSGVEWRGGETLTAARLSLPGLSLQAAAAELHQAVHRDPERVLLQPPGQPVPHRGGEGAAGQEVRHNRQPGTRRVTALLA